MNIRGKLMKIQSELKAPKGQFNDFGNYKYRSMEDILEALKPLLLKYETYINVTDEIVLIGERYYVKATASIVDTNEGETAVKAVGYAREDVSRKGMDLGQLTGSTSSYARKYALNGLFAIDDTKDNDFTNKHDKAIKPEPKKKPNNYNKAPIQNKQSVGKGRTTITEGGVVIDFGKHTGKTLNNIFKEDRSYVEWLSSEAKDERVRKAASKLLKPKAPDKELDHQEELPDDVPF